MKFEQLSLRELLEDREKRFQEAKSLRDKSAGEKRELTTEEAAKVDGLINDVRTIDKLIDEKRAAEAQQNAERRNQSFEELERRTNEPGTQVRGPEPSQRDLFDGDNLQKYSLLRAIKLRSAGKPIDGFEAEVSEEMAHRTGKQPQGFLVPWNLPVRSHREAEHRTFGVTAGAGAIPRVLSASMIDLLRNRVLVQRLGAQVINDLVGDFDVPKQTAGGTAYWLGEDGEPTASNPTVGQAQLRIKTVGAYTDITRRLMNQTSIDAEMFVRNDLVRTLAIEMDRAALNGSGDNNQPEGLLQNSNLEVVAIGDNGGPITWQKIVELETAVAVANADQGALSYVTTSGGRGAMKSIERFSSTGRTIWSDEGTINGYPAHATNQLPTNLEKGEGEGAGENLHPIIFGDWSSIIIGFWSGLDVLVDPFSKSKSGGVRVVALQDTDITFRHDESFAAILDFDPSVLIAE